MGELSTAIQIVLFGLSFVGVWLGAGFVVDEVSSMARSLKLSSFTLSFFLLGILTSLPEMTVGITAVIEDDPEILIGTLIGGVLIIFLLVIPLLAVIGNGVSLPHRFDKKQLLFSLLIIIAPSLLISDREVTVWEAVLLVALYSALFAFFAKKESISEKISDSIAQRSGRNVIRLAKISGGVAMLALSSHQIISSTEYFAELLHWSPFLVGLLAVALGTNIPELSLVFRSVYGHKKDIALADYIGSAAANTLLFGLGTLFYGATIVIPNHFLQRFIFLITALVLFFVFSRSKNSLSRWEGVSLVVLYGAFMALEIIVASN